MLLRMPASTFLALLLLFFCVRTRADTDEQCVLGADGTCVDDGGGDPEVYPDLVVQANATGHYDLGYGVAQVVAPGSKERDETIRVLKRMVHYMKTSVVRNETLKDIRAHCKNEHDSCAFWATIGECDANPQYMTINCAPACNTCHQLSFDFRCPKSEAYLNKERIWNKGDLNKMFRRIAKEYEQNVTILTTPDVDHKGETPPWVLYIDNFLSDEECDTLIDLGAKRGYEKSKDVGEKKHDGTYGSLESNGRTSSNAWCVEDCYEHETSKEVLRKLENLTGIPDENGEYLQLLRYHEGQFYERHHDYIQHHNHRNMGVRILTVFLYLNDVEKGGGTKFNDLDLVVEAKKGRVLLWPSVKDSYPDMKDHRTHHEALPVEKGIKYGANAWMHQRNFKEAYAVGCI